MTVHLQRDGDFGHLVFDHPPANTLPDPVFVEPSELASFLEEPALRGVVVRGAGRHFCGGADIEALRARLQDPEGLGSALTRGKALLRQLADAPVPVVAAIRGQCLGAGLEIALACHARVASEGAMLGFPESTLGLIPGLGGSVGDGDRVERRVRADLLLTGRLVGADEALALGVVDRVVPGSGTVAAAEAFLARWIDGRPSTLVRALMEALRNARRLPRDEALRRETDLFLRVAREART